MSGRVAFLLVLGLMRLLAEGLSLPSLAGLADATIASPGPRREARAHTSIELEWEGADGARRVLPLSADSLERVWPAERRETYRALLSRVDRGADRGPDPMAARALRRGLCGEGELARDLGLDVPRGVHRFRLRADGVTSEVACP
jgi:hypothetical protein